MNERNGTMISKEDIERLKSEFKASQEVLTALGDENRQHMIIKMASSGKCQGMRVGEMTEATNLSRPAVSHHLKILKQAGLLKVRREGTKNYYYFDADKKAMDMLIALLIHAKKIMESLPDRR